ncbi:MAG: Ig-like domain-containing protein [Eubacterium sp.]|jgi:hypothetical protein|nr:Ig-like domain-containing protein [Eubacterium sp.]MCH4046550.1 Ig-like domain-containing protein [Eubacterium sp.]MCH4079645.1 Ig-like domain-containing protein [Eubacterium sp.]MCH4110203.1 Ig-like domain-containing protein [Eubacterium sp.]MCI1308145.1 Ig-like domain-containing protein [Eubacterium sp.]
MNKKTLSKLTSVLLAAAMVLAFMPALTFSSHAAAKKAKTSITRVAPKAAKTSVQLGKSLTFKVKVLPSKLAKKTTFTSSNTKVLTVNKKTGKASAKKAGTAKVTAKNGKLSASWTVKVTKAAKTERATEAAAKQMTSDLTQFQNKSAQEIAGMSDAEINQLIQKYSAMFPGVTVDSSMLKSLTADQQKMLAVDLEMLSHYTFKVTPGTQSGNTATVNVQLTTYKYSTINSKLLTEVITDKSLGGVANVAKMLKAKDQAFAAKFAGVMIQDLYGYHDTITAGGETTKTVTVAMEYKNGVWQTTKTTDLTKASNTGAFKLADAMTDGMCTDIAHAATLIK